MYFSKLGVRLPTRTVFWTPRDAQVAAIPVTGYYKHRRKEQLKAMPCLYVGPAKNQLQGTARVLVEGTYSIAITRDITRGLPCGIIRPPVEGGQMSPPRLRQVKGVTVMLTRRLTSIMRVTVHSLQMN